VFHIHNCVGVRRVETLGRSRRGDWEEWRSTRLSERSDHLEGRLGQHRSQGVLTNSKPSWKD